MQEADPLEGQGTDGHLVRTALGALLAIEGAGPEGLVDGLRRPLDEGLAHEGRALPTPMHPAFLATALRHWRDARVVIYVCQFLELATLEWVTFPRTVGSGTIVVVVTRSAHASGLGWQASLLAHAAIFVAAILLAVLVFFCYAYAPRLKRVLPVHAISGVQRLISFILLCIGAQIAWDGLATLLRSLQTLPLH